MVHRNKRRYVGCAETDSLKWGGGKLKNYHILLIVLATTKKLTGVIGDYGDLQFSMYGCELK